MVNLRRFLRLNGGAVAIGVLGGLAVVLFRYLIRLVEEAAFNPGPGLLGRVTAKETNTFISSPWGWLVILVPAAGGLVVGLIRTLRPDTKQQGVAEVMAAVQAKGGVLRGRTAWGHAIISAITVGTGGSTGREGPISYIGAALGSTVGRRLQVSARDLKILLGCGFAAGIGATFNAPLGGTLLALELIVPEFSTHAFIPLVFSAVAGTATAHLFLGADATFDVPPFVMGDPWQLALYIALGVLVGLGGVWFIRSLDASNRAWRNMAVPLWAKPMLGGLLVGIMGYFMLELTGQYHIFGSGYSTITDVLNGNANVPGETLAWIPLILLVAAKPLATSITIGSGGGGGVFSASLFQGAVWGGLFGLAAQLALPGAPIDAASFALIGMGAFYAATARATLTAIVILAELTNDFTVILPLMLCAVTADAVSVALTSDSIYTVRLTEKGILYDHDRTQSPLDLLTVRQAMSPQVDVLPDSLTVTQAFSQMLEMGHTGYPVVDGEGLLKGVVTRRDLSRHIQEGKGESPLVDVVSGKPITVFPHEMLHRARDRMFGDRIGRLIVVDPLDRRRVLGILTRSDLLRAEAEKDVEHDDSWAAPAPGVGVKR